MHTMKSLNVAIPVKSDKVFFLIIYVDKNTFLVEAHKHFFIDLSDTFWKHALGNCITCKAH